MMNLLIHSRLLWQERAVDENDYARILFFILLFFFIFFIFFLSRLIFFLTKIIKNGEEKKGEGVKVWG